MGDTDKKILYLTDFCKPVACKLVDFQFSRYAPAALDVVTLIILTTYKNFRTGYWDDLLNFYYTNFASQIKDKNIPIECFDIFAESCRHFYLAGLIEKSIFSHYPPSDLPEHLTSHLKKIDYNGYNYITNFPFEIVKIAFNCDFIYRKRLKDVALEVVERYLSNQ